MREDKASKLPSRKPTLIKNHSRKSNDALSSNLIDKKQQKNSSLKSNITTNSFSSLGNNSSHLGNNNSQLGKNSSQLGHNSSQGNEIDDLFNILKSTKQVKKAEEDKLKIDKIKSDKLNKKKIVKKIIISPEAPVERIDKESGYPVYKAHLLKVGEGGGTPQCPFDCDCCF